MNKIILKIINHFLVLTLIFVLAFSGLINTNTAFAADWYNTSWGYRVKITILASMVDANLTDFPVYVDLSDLPSSFHANVNQTDARDIRVTKADGTTELPREVVSYDSSTNTGELHFKADSLSSSTDTDFYIYYGNVNASEPTSISTYGSENVWSNYEAVMHLNSTSFIDSTGNGHTPTNNGVTISTIGNRNVANFTGGAYLDYGNQINMGLDDLSISVFFATTSGGTLVAKSFYSGEDSRYALFHNSGSLTSLFDYGTLNANTGYSSSTPINGSVHQAVVTYDRDSNNSLYFDGNMVDAISLSSYSSQDFNKTNSLLVGTYNGTTGAADPSKLPYTGKMYNLRFSKTTLSADWISTEYNNQISSSSFYSISSEETPPTGGGGGTFSCGITTSTACTGVVLLRMSGSANAHAELPNQSTPVYDNNVVCCTGLTGIGNSCAANNHEVIARLSGMTNAHVEENTENGVNYTQNACLSSIYAGDEISIGYQSNNCDGYDTTLFSMEKSPTNSMVGGPNEYNNKVCAKIFSQSISFDISATSVGFGNLTSSGLRYATSNGVGSSSETESYNITVSTNAPYGYGVYIRGDSLKNGSVVIDPIGGTNITPSPGSNLFGLRAVATGGSGTVATPYDGSGFAYNATSSSASTLAQASSGDGNTTTYSIRTVATIDSLLDPGEYSTNLTYIVTANF